jgi:Rrf2 family protein
MLIPSVTTTYALRALICLSGSRERWLQAEEIACTSGIPRPYLAKVLGRLNRSGLIETKRGYRGGYRLAGKTRRTTLLDVVQAIEGSDCLKRCLLGLGLCSPERKCPIHPFWSKERRRIAQRLRAQSLERLASTPSLILPGRSERPVSPGLRARSASRQRGAARSTRKP